MANSIGVVWVRGESRPGRGDDTGDLHIILYLYIPATLLPWGIRAGNGGVADSTGLVRVRRGVVSVP